MKEEVTARTKSSKFNMNARDADLRGLRIGSDLAELIKAFGGSASRLICVIRVIRVR